jgi:hypothetical protein
MEKEKEFDAPLLLLHNIAYMYTLVNGKRFSRAHHALPGEMPRFPPKK